MNDGTARPALRWRNAAGEARVIASDPNDVRSYEIGPDPRGWYVIYILDNAPAHDAKQLCVSATLDEAKAVAEAHWQRAPIDLAACPCCGPVIADAVHFVGGDPRGWRVVCVLCDLQTRAHDSRENAASSWNRRSVAPPTEAEVIAAASCIPDFDRRALAERHAGDCTRQSGACSRCAAEEIRAGVRHALGRFAAGRSRQSGDKT